MGSGDDSCKFTLVIFPKAGSEKETDPLKKYRPLLRPTFLRETYSGTSASFQKTTG